MDFGISNNTLMAQMHAAQSRTPMHNSISRAQLAGDDLALWDAAVEFESFFINMMFREMRNTINRDDGIMPVGLGEEVFQEMLDTEMSAAAARGGGMGLAQTIFRQMSNSNQVVYARDLISRGDHVVLNLDEDGNDE